MTMRTIKLLAAGSLLALAAACSDNNNDDDGGTPTPPAPSVPFEDRFGTGFGAKFRAVRNSEPVKPVTGDFTEVPVAKQAADKPGVDITADPRDFSRAANSDETPAGSAPAGAQVRSIAATSTPSPTRRRASRLVVATRASPTCAITRTT